AVLVVLGHPERVARDDVELAAGALDLQIGVGVVAEQRRSAPAPDLLRHGRELVVCIVVRPGQPVECRGLELGQAAEGRPGKGQPERSGRAGLEQAGARDAAFVDAHVSPSCRECVTGSCTASSGSHQSVTSWSGFRARSPTCSRPKSDASTGASTPSQATATRVWLPRNEVWRTRPFSPSRGSVEMWIDSGRTINTEPLDEPSMKFDSPMKSATKRDVGRG